MSEAAILTEQQINGPLSPSAVLRGGRRELPAYVSNGVLGLRVREVPLLSGMAILSGYSGEHPVKTIEAAARIPYPLGGKISVNDIELSDATYRVRDIEQSYDFSSGELTTRFVFAPEDVAVRVTVLTFCSRTEPTLACQSVEVVCDKDCKLVVSACLDTAEIEGRPIHISKEVDGCDGLVRWESPRGISTCGLAYSTRLDGGEKVEYKLAERADELTTHFAFRAEGSARFRLCQITSAVPGVMHSQPDLQAARLVAFAAHTGFDALREDNRRAWERIWKGRIRLVGAEQRWQALADAAFFYLNTSVHSSSPASTSIFGLATWKDYHYYYGHVMWDIEAFAVPVVALAQPHAAAAMLNYRFSKLDAARKTAQLAGRRGLQFPWESAMSTGQEAAPLPGTASWHADHVTLDVAIAFATYAALTGDDQFAREKAWPVLSGVAEWIDARVSKTPRGFEFRRSMGIAERKEPSDNPAVSNMSAKRVLRQTREIATKLGMEEDARWRILEEGLVLPVRDGIVLSHDDFDPAEEKGATPEPLFGVFPLWQQLPHEQERATIRFYLDRADEYIGSPMLSALYGVWAAWLGDRDLSSRLLEEGYGKFVTARFAQTLEYRPDRFPDEPMAGPFFANICGFLMSLLFGFPGIRPGAEDPRDWPCRKVALPSGWDSIEVDQLSIHGREMRLVARHGAERALLE